jgi:uncharacterized protein (DUF302 family)
VTYGKTVTVDMPFDEAVVATKAALMEQGFGTLMEIDIKATLKEKIGAEKDDYLILGACNPRLADAALNLEPQLGLLLPCNVVVRSEEGRTIVQALDPEIMVRVTGKEDLADIAAEAGRLLDAALATLENAQT